MHTAATSPAGPSDDRIPSEIVRAVATGVAAGEPQAEQKLYELLCRTVRYKFAQQLPAEDVDDALHNLYVALLQQLRTGRLREADCLLGYASTMAAWSIAGYLRQLTAARERHCELDGEVDVPSPDPSAEAILVNAEYQALMREVLATLSRRDCEALHRFYLQEQTKEQICAEMGLTPDQFRLLKSRAKMKFVEATQRQQRIGGGLRRLQQVLVRASNC